MIAKLCEYTQNIDLCALSGGVVWMLYLKALVTQLCPTLCDPMDCSPSCHSVHGILQARMLEWFVIFYSRKYLTILKRCFLNSKVLDSGCYVGDHSTTLTCMCSHTHIHMHMHTHSPGCPSAGPAPLPCWILPIYSSSLGKHICCQVPPGRSPE